MSCHGMCGGKCSRCDESSDYNRDLKEKKLIQKPEAPKKENKEDERIKILKNVLMQITELRFLFSDKENKNKLDIARSNLENILDITQS